jgi:tetratricopeptide (TPR) repeat protein
MCSLVALSIGLWAATAEARPSAPPAPATFEQWWGPSIARLERELAAENAAGVKEARTELARKLDPRLPAGPAARVRLALAYADWRLTYLPSTTPEERRRGLEDAVVQLRSVLAADSGNAEAHALLGSVFGSQVSLQPEKTLVLGPRAGKAMEKAAELAPDNPRVALLRGVGAFHTPPAHGGGRQKAEELLRRSLALFEREPADKPWPNWGRFDAHAWLGQALARRGDPQGARAEYQKALALRPASGWVRTLMASLGS